MSRFLRYSVEQAYLLPPNVKDVLGEDHLCFFIHRAVEHLDLSKFEDAYGEEGGALYAPALMLKVWLYAYAIGLTSARRLEQRMREELGLRYLAGGAEPDNWALSAFRRRHGRGINDVFTQVVEMARGLGEGQLSRTDEEARFLKTRKGFLLGYTGEIAVSEDQLIVGQRVTQAKTDNDSLLPMIAELQSQCGELPENVLGDAGYLLKNIQDGEGLGIGMYVPDSNLAHELNTGKRCRRTKLDAVQRRMRQKLRSPAGRWMYGRRKGMVEPVF